MFWKHAFLSSRPGWVARRTSGAASRAAASRPAFRRIRFEPLEERVVLSSGMVIQQVGVSAAATESFLDTTGTKLVVTGYADTGSSTGVDVAALRYNLDGSAPGSLDTSFGNNGIITTQVLSTDTTTDAAVTAEGKIAVVGYSRPGKGSYNNEDSFVVRYNEGGSLDKSFGGTGIVRTNLGSLYDHYLGVTFQADGKIVAGGYGSYSPQTSRLVRFTSAGKLDSTFGAGGIVSNVFAGVASSHVTDVMLQQDGGEEKIVIAGYAAPNSNVDFALARYNLNGTLDTTFGDGIEGTVFTDIGYTDIPMAMAVYPDSGTYANRIVMAGYSDSLCRMSIARYTPNGKLDASFGNGQGFITVDLGDINAEGAAVAIQPDGKIVVAGSETPDWSAGESRFVLVRLNPDGSLDDDFGAGGKVLMPISNLQHAEAESVVIQPDGKIVVSGWANDGSDNPPYSYAPRFMVVARFLPGGKLDLDFGGPSDPGSATVSINDVSKVEGDAGTSTEFEFLVSLSAPRAEGTVIIHYATADGTATAGADYAATIGDLYFAPGETTKKITVSVNDDSSYEPDETFFVNLSNDSNELIAQGVGTIMTDSTLAISDVSAVEGDAGTTQFLFTVTRSGDTTGTGAPTVRWSTADDSALAGSDYASATGEVDFTGGATSLPIIVSVNGDTLFEPDETFFVNLSDASGARIADAQGKATIQNDDEFAIASLSIDDVSLSEGNSGTTTFTFTVTRSGNTSGTVTVAFATANGAAKAPGDYKSKSGSVTFQPGDDTKTINVSVIGETKVEANETFFVNLSNPTGATISDGQGIGTIVDDDGSLLMANSEKQTAAAAELTLEGRGKRLATNGVLISTTVELTSPEVTDLVERQATARIRPTPVQPGVQSDLPERAQWPSAASASNAAGAADLSLIELSARNLKVDALLEELF